MRRFVLNRMAAGFRWGGGAWHGETGKVPARVSELVAVTHTPTA